MAKKSNWIVVTDLDASLLDESYSYEEALNALDTLQAKEIPIVLNSSKTLDEMIVIAEEWQWPSKPILVGENGATLAFPCNPEGKDAGGAWSDFIEASEVKGGYLCLYDLEERAAILGMIKLIQNQNDFAFRGFSDFSDEELTELTGLRGDAVHFAKARKATEPILWEGCKDDYKSFVQLISEVGLKALRGGQFTHIMHKKYDKSIGMAWVVSLFTKRYSNCSWKTLALGDSPNDIVMLEQADFAVVIPNKAKGTITLRRKDYILANNYASEGWNNSVLKLLHLTKLLK